ncbi:MAG: glycosyltransferase family 39 protein [Deltaproteobacteria bacterium]|nr:glycosyltransferase family 39 protein [Deltaproteobacteria bacterium]
MFAARLAPPKAAAALLVVVLAVAAWVYGSGLGEPVLLDDPNDAQYAEVAREMVESGEWLSPQLDGVLFLNKPPLAYWLIGVSYKIFGVSELAARLPGALSALVLAWLMWRLGCALWNEWVGLNAAAVWLGTAGVLIEARFVRPDLLLTAAVAGALLACTRLRQCPTDRWALISWQVALAAALLAKGIVGLLLPGGALVVAVLAAGRAELVRTLSHPRAWWLFALLVVPWHVVAGLRHAGFAWDYIVNQHLLFFLDRKIPRDSEGIALWHFWAAFAARLFPWTVFVPLAAVKLRPRGDFSRRWAGGLVLGWAAAVMALFSAAGSRLEHYAIPALPACALMVGALFHNGLGRALLIAHVLPLIGTGVGMVLVVPPLLASADFLEAATGLPELSRLAGYVFTAAAVAMLALAAVRPRLAAGPVLVAMCALVPIMRQGLTMMAPFNSSAPLAAVINNVAAAGDTLVYEAPIEYQSGAGLFFYTRRKWAVLRPAGFVPPPYLAPHQGELFIDRAELERRWHGAERIFLVSDPLARGRQSMVGIVPEPMWVVAHIGNRWIVSNQSP